MFWSFPFPTSPDSLYSQKHSLLGMHFTGWDWEAVLPGKSVVQLCQLQETTQENKPKAVGAACFPKVWLTFKLTLPGRATAWGFLRAKWWWWCIWEFLPACVIKSFKTKWAEVTPALCCGAGITGIPFQAQGICRNCMKLEVLKRKSYGGAHLLSVQSFICT